MPRSPGHIFLSMHFLFPSLLGAQTAKELKDNWQDYQKTKPPIIWSAPRGQITPTKAKSWSIGVSHDSIAGGMSSLGTGRVVTFKGADTALEVGIFGKKFGNLFF